MLSLILTSSSSLELPVACSSRRKLGEGLGMRLCHLVPRLSVGSHQEPGYEARDYDAPVLVFRMISVFREIRKEQLTARLALLPLLQAEQDRR